jgi:hypothetical protein
MNKNTIAVKAEKILLNFNFRSKNFTIGKIEILKIMANRIGTIIDCKTYNTNTSSIINSKLLVREES